MDLVISFWVIIAIIAVSLAFALIKSIIKAVLAALSILSILMLVATFFVVQDTIDLQKNFMPSENLFVLKNGEKVVAAFTVKNATGDMSNAMKPLKSANLTEIETSPQSRFKDQYYKIITVDQNAFNTSLQDGLTQNFDAQSLSLTKAEVEELLLSDAPLELAMSTMAQEKGFDMSQLSEAEKQQAVNEFLAQMNLESQEQFKSYLFAILLVDLVQDRGVGEVIKEFKKGNINVYPNTALFRAIKLVPSFAIDKIAARKIKVMTDEET